MPLFLLVCGCVSIGLGVLAVFGFVNLGRVETVAMQSYGFPKTVSVPSAWQETEVVLLVGFGLVLIAAAKILEALLAAVEQSGAVRFELKELRREQAASISSLGSVLTRPEFPPDEAAPTETARRRGWTITQRGTQWVLSNPERTMYFEDLAMLRDWLQHSG